MSCTYVKTLDVTIMFVKRTVNPVDFAKGVVQKSMNIIGKGNDNETMASPSPVHPGGAVCDSLRDNMGDREGS